MTVCRLSRALALVALPLAALGMEQRMALQKPNPIRKVVGLLQAMQKKVTEEGEKEKELFENFACYCKKNQKRLEDSLASAGPKAAELESSVKASEEQKTQLEADLKQAKADREAAKAVLQEALNIREKGAAAFSTVRKETESNIGAMGKAVEALRKGTGSLLQTGDAQALRAIIQGRQSMVDEDREAVISFLDGSRSSEDSTNSGEIIGILSELLDQMKVDLQEASASEETNVKQYQELVSAKEKEIEALTQGIESKTERVGELGVAVVNSKNDLEGSQNAAVQNAEFKATLDKSCSTKKGEYEEREKTRGQELQALAETIKLLNDDDALDLFKKTLPGPAMFIQLQVTASALRARALDVVNLARRPGRGGLVLVDLVALALRSKKVSFEKVIKLVDTMVTQLKKEQVDDDKKKDYCAKELDLADDKKKSLDRAVADADTAIASAAEKVQTLKEEIEALDIEVKELDKAVAEAAEQRKRENSEFTELIASNTAAKQLLNLAKNRLNQFYNPKLYTEPAKKELSAQDRIAANFGGAFVQVEAHVHHRQAPGPEPETASGPYQKAEESAGVLAMVDLLIKDLDKEITEATAEEQNSQEDYEALTKDSAAKRTEDLKALTEKGAAVADLEAGVEGLKSQKVSSVKELQATLEYIQMLHGDCDWLVKNFDVRKQARAGEVDSLTKAKAVLSGADLSLLQTKEVHRGFLRRH